MSHPSSHVSVILYGHLTIKVFAHGFPAITYLGYPLHLSPDECRLLHVLLTHPASGSDPQGYFPVAAVISALQGAVALASPMNGEERQPLLFSDTTAHPRVSDSAEQIANLVARINRKAAAIGARRLILGKSHHGYRLNPYM